MREEGIESPHLTCMHRHQCREMKNRIEELERQKAAANRLAASMTAKYAALIESKACPVCNAEAAKWAEQEVAEDE